MDKKILIGAVILGALGIILGAFAAHAFENSLNSDQIDTYETGVKYQMYHALFLLFIGLESRINFKSKRSIFYLVIVGIVLFSGSIYGLATDHLTTFDFKSIGFITPIGGTMLILSWIILLFSLIKSTKFEKDS